MLNRRLMLMADSSPMLYDHGMTYNSKTGGWEQEITYSGDLALQKMELAADSMAVDQASTVSKILWYRCTGLVDLTQWNKIKITYTRSAASTMDCKLAAASAADYNASKTQVDLPNSGSESTVELDVSAITGSRYILVSLRKGTTSSLPAKFNAFKIWLE